ncbi:hypothetical protein SDC9_145565 [bioreactor metagenome]|uniref:HK97 gp10 family phage protein n=1 Tax=bioreactor metagenome TaxID=1076179 RepID=A0A645EAG9_9ZZZZ|nr:HK97-gp10 family putative phage morphogenesis protein [Candidatus Metalachnospira sp.]
MAKAVFQMPEDFLIKLSRLGDKTDEICEKVLDAGGKVVEEKVRSNLTSVIGKDIKTKSRSTGELISSLGVSPPKQDKNGIINVKIGFSEPRSDGKSNAMLASVIEYGKSGQPPKPFLKPAKTSSKKAAVEAMKAAFDEEVEKL